MKRRATKTRSRPASARPLLNSFFPERGREDAHLSSSTARVLLSISFDLGRWGLGPYQVETRAVVERLVRQALSYLIHISTVEIQLRKFYPVTAPRCTIEYPPRPVAIEAEVDAGLTVEASAPGSSDFGRSAWGAAI